MVQSNSDRTQKSLKWGIAKSAGDVDSRQSTSIKATGDAAEFDLPLLVV